MSDPSDTCAHIGCDELGDVEREYRGNGNRLRFCEAHDPLDDPVVESSFKAVEGDESD